MSRKILNKYNIKAKKSLGQNFLVNESIVEKISTILNIKGKNVIEVGPGYGALTEKLLEQKAKSLTLVELDNDMIDILTLRLKNKELNIDGIDFKIEKIDILEYSSAYEEYYVIANIPYYITSPILRHFLYNINSKPEKMLILMQKDVGDKILGKGKNKSSVISLFVTKKCLVKEVLFVGKENFVPAPKIESTVLLFEILDKYDFVSDNQFMEFIKKGFREPRKKLIKNLSNSGYNKEEILTVFQKLGIEENTRGEDLDIEIWCNLCIELNKKILISKI